MQIGGVDIDHHAESGRAHGTIRREGWMLARIDGLHEARLALERARHRRCATVGWTHVARRGWMRAQRKAGEIVVDSSAQFDLARVAPGFDLQHDLVELAQRFHRHRIALKLSAFDQTHARAQEIAVVPDQFRSHRANHRDAQPCRIDELTGGNHVAGQRLIAPADKTCGHQCRGRVCQNPACTDVVGLPIEQQQFALELEPLACQAHFDNVAFQCVLDEGALFTRRSIQLLLDEQIVFAIRGRKGGNTSDHRDPRKHDDRSQFDAPRLVGSSASRV